MRRKTVMSNEGGKTVMSNMVTFCTCTDLSCPFHPTNHDKGCTPCIAKNIKENEVPTCLFKKADPDYAGEGYKFEDFARLVLEKK